MKNKMTKERLEREISKMIKNIDNKEKIIEELSKENEKIQNEFDCYIEKQLKINADYFNERKELKENLMQFENNENILEAKIKRLENNKNNYGKNIAEFEILRSENEKLKTENKELKNKVLIAKLQLFGNAVNEIIRPEHLKKITEFAQSELPEFWADVVDKIKVDDKEQIFTEAKLPTEKKTYRLKKDYEDNNGFIKKGTEKTISEWEYFFDRHNITGISLNPIWFEEVKEEKTYTKKEMEDIIKELFYNIFRNSNYPNSYIDEFINNK